MTVETLKWRIDKLNNEKGKAIGAKTAKIEIGAHGKSPTHKEVRYED
jgi:hypothetical protein